MQIQSDYWVQTLPATIGAARNAEQRGRNPTAASGDYAISISDDALSRLAAETSAKAGSAADTLDVPTKHLVEDIVNDPAYGEKYADMYASSIHAAWMPMSLMESPEWAPGSANVRNQQSILESARNQLQTAWQAIRSQGGSPAEDYAKLLQYELSMPQSYWDAQDPTHALQAEGGIRGQVAAKLAYLQQCIATKG